MINMAVSTIVMTVSYTRIGRAPYTRRPTVHIPTTNTVIVSCETDDWYTAGASDVIWPSKSRITIVTYMIRPAIPALYVLVVSLGSLDTVPE